MCVCFWGGVCRDVVLRDRIVAKGSRVLCAWTRDKMYSNSFVARQGKNLRVGILLRTGGG